MCGGNRFRAANAEAAWIVSLCSSKDLEVGLDDYTARSINEV